MQLVGVAAHLKPGLELAMSFLPSSLAEMRAKEFYILQKASPHSRLSSQGAHRWRPKTMFLLQPQHYTGFDTLGSGPMCLHGTVSFSA